MVLLLTSRISITPLSVAPLIYTYIYYKKIDACVTMEVYLFLATLFFLNSLKGLLDQKSSGGKKKKKKNDIFLFVVVYLGRRIFHPVK